MSESEASRARRLARMREYNKTYKRKRKHVRGDPEKYREYNRTYCAAYYRKRRIDDLGALRKEYAENARRWRKNNPEAARRKDKMSRERRRAQSREYQQRINVKIARRIRHRLWSAINGREKPASAVRALGCSIDFFREYIAAKFTVGMEWSNHGEWHLDHVRPLSSFDLTDLHQFKTACHYTNYQPLWASDNLSKGARLAA